MSQHRDLWEQTAAAFDQRYQSVAESQWSTSTPCEGWAVKDLVDHAVGTQRMLGGSVVGAEVAEDADWPDDPRRHPSRPANRRGARWYDEPSGVRRGPEVDVVRYRYQ